MKLNEATAGWPIAVIAAMALAVLAGACSAPAPVGLEDLGLMIEADIQAGSSFEVVVPKVADTTVSVVAAPPGVSAAIGDVPSGGSMLLSVAVDPDTPRGTYGLALVAARNGEEFELSWPFDVVDAIAPVSSSPDALRDELVAAIAAKDAGALRSLWPVSSWETLGTDVLATFVPRSESGACDRLSETSAHCFVFERNVPFVLGLTMELQNSGGWALTVVGLDSTN